MSLLRYEQRLENLYVFKFDDIDKYVKLNFRESNDRRKAEKLEIFLAHSAYYAFYSYNSKYDTLVGSCRDDGRLIPKEPNRRIIVALTKVNPEEFRKEDCSLLEKVFEWYGLSNKTKVESLKFFSTPRVD